MRKQEDKESFKSGATSSKVPRYDSIPYAPFVRLAKRYELGDITHKEKAWNANKNHHYLFDDAFLMARAAHCVDHALKYMAKLRGEIPNDGDDDAAAIMWAGSFLIAADEARKNRPLQKRDRRNKRKRS